MDVKQKETKAAFDGILKEIKLRKINSIQIKKAVRVRTAFFDNISV